MLDLLSSNNTYLVITIEKYCYRYILYHHITDRIKVHERKIHLMENMTG